MGKCLRLKHENPSLAPSTQIKADIAAHASVTPELGEWSLSRGDPGAHWPANLA